MSAVFHTPIASGAPGTSTTVNNPLQDLDDALQVILDPADSTLKAGAVDAAAVLADGVVTTAKILDANVTTGKLAANAVTTAKIAADAVTATEIATGAVGTTELAAGAVTTAKIAAANVTSTELASNAVTTAKITDANVTTVKIADANITTAKILDANVTTAKIADLNITGPKLSLDALTPGAGFAFEPVVKGAYKPAHNFDGRTRWHQPQALSLVTDSTNPYGTGYSWLHTTSSNVQGGVYLYVDDGKIKAGDYVVGVAKASAAGSNWQLNIRPFDSSSSALAAASTSSIKTGDGTVKDFETAALLVPANTAFFIVWMARTSGTDNENIHAIDAHKGTYSSSFALAETPGMFAHSQRQPGNLIDFPFNEAPGMLGVGWGGFGGLERWLQPQNATIIFADPDNPSGGNSFVSTAGATAGIKIHMKEKGIKPGDTVTLSAMMFSSSTSSSGALRARYVTSTGTVCSDSSPISVSRTVSYPTTTPEPVTVTLSNIPSDAAQIWLWVALATGTPAIKVFEWWASIGRVVGPRATLATSSYAQQNAIAVGKNLNRINEAGLQQWRYKLARMLARQAAWNYGGWTDTSASPAVIAFLGHSWVARKNMFAALATYFRTDLGDGGNGWVSAASDNSSGVLFGATWSRAGTWTDRDGRSGSGQDLTAKGLDLMDATSTDVATPASITIASSGTKNTAFVIHYLEQPDGGDFRYQVDGGAWTTVNTANASTVASVRTISGLSDATHSIKIEVTVAGLAGVTIMGVDLQRTGFDGVRLHKLGNGSTRTGDWAGVDATIWETQLTAINPDLVPILCLTNDKSNNVVPATSAANLSILIDRIRAAAPYADILLVTDGETGDSTTYTMAAYDSAVRDLAVRKGVSFFSGYDLMNPYAANAARHLITPVSGAADSLTGEVADNGRHLTDLGAQYFASALYRMLKAD